MISCAYTFSVLATKYERVNGIVDYAEAAMGKTGGYYVGWFMALIYYPTLTSVLAWVSARYTAALFGWTITGGECMTIAGFFPSRSYALNALSPVRPENSRSRPRSSNLSPGPDGRDRHGIRGSNGMIL